MLAQNETAASLQRSRRRGTLLECARLLFVAIALVEAGATEATGARLALHLAASLAHHASDVLHDVGQRERELRLLFHGQELRGVVQEARDLVFVRLHA